MSKCVYGAAVREMPSKAQCLLMLRHVNANIISSLDCIWQMSVSLQHLSEFLLQTFCGDGISAVKYCSC